MTTANPVTIHFEVTGESLQALRDSALDHARQFWGLDDDEYEIGSFQAEPLVTAGGRVELWQASLCVWRKP